MLLSELLKMISTNPEVKVTIIDDGTDIVTFNAAGYSAISEELNSRTVDKIIFAADMKLVKIYLEKVVEPEPDPDSGHTDDGN